MSQGFKLLRNGSDPCELTLISKGKMEGVRIQCTARNAEVYVDKCYHAMMNRVGTFEKDACRFFILEYDALNWLEQITIRLLSFPKDSKNVCVVLNVEMIGEDKSDDTEGLTGTIDDVKDRKAGVSLDYGLIQQMINPSAEVPDAFQQMIRMHILKNKAIAHSTMEKSMQSKSIQKKNVDGKERKDDDGKEQKHNENPFTKEQEQYIEKLIQKQVEALEDRLISKFQQLLKG